MASSSVRFTQTVGGRTGAPMPHAVGRGDEDAPALVTEVESLLERQLQEVIMRGGAKPTIREIKAGEVRAEQGTQTMSCTCC